ncbi:MAG: cyclohexa-1,5-dienecarbonyl-CoA hydratase [Rhodomicrobium sp.]
MTDPVKVWFERDERLLRLRLDRPKANVLDAAMISALDAAFSDHGAKRGLLGILIDATGPHFSFGASVEEHLPAQCAAMLGGFHRLILRVLGSPVPVMMAVRGQCLGGGLELVSAGHLIFASPNARLGQPEIQIGVFAPAASCLLPERIGLASAEDMLISGRSFTAEEAYRAGLVTEIAADPEAAALEYFDKHLAPKSASSLRFAVRAVRGALVERATSRLAEVERLYLNELMSTRDAAEGLEAFLAKRPAQWSGN